MAKYKASKFDAGIIPVTGDGRGETISVRTVHNHTTTLTKLTDGDLIQLCKIPAGHEIVGLQLFCGDLDASTGLAFSVGLMDETDTELETVFVATSTLGQAGGTLAIPATTTMFTTAAGSVDKILAVEITTTATTIAAADAVIGCVVQYAAI